MLQSDVDALDSLLATDLVFTNHLGAVQTKEDDLFAHRTKIARLDSLELTDQRIRLLDNAAIVTVRAKIGGVFAGVAASGTFRFTRVWSPNTAGDWQVIAAHSTLVTDVTSA
jgi:hypothetical protein